MRGQTPAVMLPLVDEAVGAGILRAGEEDLAFKHKLIWRAVIEAVPPPARQAMHRQYGEMLLARGGSAMTAAAHLLKGARQGGSAVAAGLVAAAERVLRSSPQTAADLSLRALELTEVADPARFRRTVRAAGALTAAARLEEAASLVSAALAQPQPTANDAPLRGVLASILCLQGQARQAHAEAETVLGLAAPDGPAARRGGRRAASGADRAGGKLQSTRPGREHPGCVRRVRRTRADRGAERARHDLLG